VRAVVPEHEALALLGALPDDVDVDVWDGRGSPPSGAEPVSLWVPSWWHADEAFADALGKLPGLRVVQLLTAGHDHVSPYVPADVVLCNARGVHDATVAEWALTAILGVLRGLPDYVRRQDRGEVERFETDTLAGKTVLLLGYGSIAKALEALLAPFDVELVRVARRRRAGVHGVSDLPGLLPRAHVVVVLVALDASTARMVDRRFLAALPDQALVVNAARGGVVDQDALAAELGAGRLRAAIDVADPDPLPAGHPLLSERRLLYTPHVAGVTRRTLPNAYRFVGDQIRRLAAGEPLQGRLEAPGSETLPTGSDSA